MNLSPLSLQAWIDQEGKAKVARLLNVTVMAVNHWRKGTAYPRVAQMRKIKRLSAGRVGYAQIIDRKAR